MCDQNECWRRHRRHLCVTITDAAQQTRSLSTHFTLTAVINSDTN